MVYKKETRYRMVYEVNGVEKNCYPRSEEQHRKNVETCKSKGYTIKEIKKLYPWAKEKKYHNLELVYNRSYNMMSDMLSGAVPYDEREYDRLEELREEAQYCMNVAMSGNDWFVTWMPWEDLQRCNKISNLAVEYRVGTCIEKGRADLIQYC